MVAYRRWSLRRGGRTQRFLCIGCVKFSGLASDKKKKKYLIYSSNRTVLFSAFISFAFVVVVVFFNVLFVVWRFGRATSGGEGSLGSKGVAVVRALDTAQTADCRLQTTDCRPQTADHRLQIAN